VAEPGGCRGCSSPPYHLGFHGSPPKPPLQILWRKKKEGENFEEEEEGMRGGRRKKERRAPPSSGSWLRRCGYVF